LPASAAATNAGRTATPIPAAPTPWPALDAALDSLRQSPVPAVATAVNTVVPQPGPQLGGALVLLMSALRGGDLRGWLGQDSLDELSRMKGAQTTQSLADDFTQLARPTRSDTGEWRIFNLPLFDGGQQQQIRLYLKRRGRGNDGDAETPARFVFELDLSRLGALQLDGLSTPGRFDLVVRSTRPLPEAVRGDIGVLFGQVRDANDFTGDVYFQTMPAFAAAPATQPPPRTDDGLII
jgi:hypothetical protein